MWGGGSFPVLVVCAARVPPQRSICLTGGHRPGHEMAPAGSGLVTRWPAGSGRVTRWPAGSGLVTIWRRRATAWSRDGAGGQRPGHEMAPASSGLVTRWRRRAAAWSHDGAGGQWDGHEMATSQRHCKGHLKMVQS